MTNTLKILATGVAILIGGMMPVKADETVSHYAPEPSETLQQAVDNFVTYNRKLAAVLERDPMTTADMEEVHQFTYTLEIALARINAELGALPEVLERVHKASEGDDPAALRAASGVYLEQAAILDR
ncbi:MAG: DUF6746 family protein [Pseudomonadota bacterium]|uniref:DUF6746 family protein n=1 Tax=Roseovarius TaxID=74030 RepID=UPI0022A82440|nr:DUF6746 family protein [Roseovarius sp. EGI FJ00037]MCZ0812998.1 hypothetical protein [Roseovarius sp. EGI FJ00037]